MLREYVCLICDQRLLLLFYLHVKFSSLKKYHLKKISFLLLYYYNYYYIIIYIFYIIYIIFYIIYISDGYINIKYKLRKERVINFFKTRLNQKETDGKN